MSINEKTNFHIFTDGGSRGNPGQAAIGIVIKDENNEILHEIGETLGVATNNTAEYTAVIHALKYVIEQIKEKTCEVSLSFFLDSELVVRQLTGIYKIKDDNLNNLAMTINKLKKNFKNITFTHVRRELNKEADALVNKALDAKKNNETP
jgi:ribonuclease HI